jgi:ribosomal protein S18 acetylase RimI-like enzyme
LGHRLCDPLWVCASDLNSRAIAFYERHGFNRVGIIPDLVAPGATELLVRKRLAR